MAETLNYPLEKVEAKGTDNSSAPLCIGCPNDTPNLLHYRHYIDRVSDYASTRNLKPALKREKKKVYIQQRNETLKLFIQTLSDKSLRPFFCVK